MPAIGFHEVVDFVRPIEVVIPGVRGRLLAVLAETTAELNMRVLSELAGVSSAQASRILPELVQLGLVRRKDVPPSSLFVLDRANAAANRILWSCRHRARRRPKRGLQPSCYLEALGRGCPFFLVLLAFGSGGGLRTGLILGLWGFAGRSCLSSSAAR